MRLTLRTLLCYMDEILEPADHADIGQKIEQSEFARELMTKTRDVTKRLRLAAPVLMGKGMGGDPNTVAEYLDNTLPPERVGDFEKICLESDMHLAEAAACHQILTLVLGEPAEVDPASRERMYHIPELAAHLEREHAQAMSAPKSPQVLAQSGGAAGQSGVATATMAKTPQPRREREKLEVPDYLRESTRSRWKLKTFALVLAAGIGFVVFALINPGNVLDPLFGISNELPPHVKAPDDVVPPEIEGGEQFQPGASTAPADLGTPSDAAGAGGGSAPAFDPNAGGTAPAFDANAGGAAPAFNPGAPAPSAGGNAPVFEPGPIPAVPDGQGAEPNADVPAAEVPAKSGDESEPKLADLKNPASAAASPPTEKSKSEPTGEVPPEPGPLPTTVAAIPVNKVPVPDGGPAQQVGVYVSPSSILLRLEGEMSQWKRLASRTSLASGNRLLALPTYRPTINLASGLTLHLGGGTSIILGDTSEDGTLSINVLYGRLILAGGVGKPNSQVKLQLGDKVHNVTFTDPNATVAVYVRRVHVPGADPEAAPAPTVVDLYAAAGNVLWDDGQAKVEVVAPMHRREGNLLTGDAEIDAEKLPDWIDSEQLSSSDRLASLALDEAITLDRPAGLSLSELVDRRRSEVRSLAARCSAYVGQYEPFVQALKDQDQRASWSLHIEALREAMALSPANAARVREAFQRHAGQDGPALYRMLWGYSAADLKAGADKELVDALKSPNLEFRVLSFWNLKNITGLGLNYSPEYPEASRLRSVQRWEQLLAENKIRLPEDGSQAPAVKEAPAENESIIKE